MSELISGTFACLCGARDIVHHRYAVANGIDVWITGLQIFIRVNTVPCGEANPRILKSEMVNVWLPSSCEQDRLNFDVACFSFVREWFDSDLEQRVLSAVRLLDHLDFGDHCVKVEGAAIVTELRIK